MIDQTWANFVINSCLSRGIEHFFVAPGSRCTPLTLAVARQKNRIRLTQHFDERGLAFAALGYALGSGKPGVFICTSGTAVANAFPAVIEASVEKTPMLLLTADRPDELRDTGANQTIDQRNIFGEYPEYFSNLPVPGDPVSDGDLDGLDYLNDVLEEALAAARNGPVHLNCMFREPFTLTDTLERKSTDFETDICCGWERNGLQRRQQIRPQPSIELQGNVLVVLGHCQPREAREVNKLAMRLSCPVLSDVTSGLQAGSIELPTEFSLPTPDTVVHFGGRIVSKSWLHWIDGLSDLETRFFHVTPTGQPFNPTGLEQTRICTDLSDLDSKFFGGQTEQTFKTAWESASDKRRIVIDKFFSDSTKFNEPAIAYFVSKNCPEDHGLFVGNSMPIRDMDWFGFRQNGDVRLISANRGASGIDGLIATATGYASGIDRPITALIGDLSALHDLNSFALLAKSAHPVILIVVNNCGGHIFDLLPIEKSEHFEQFFVTAHEIQFERAAEMFGIKYFRDADMASFAKNYRDALSANNTVVIELATDRQDNLKIRREIREEIQRCSDPG